MIVASRPGNERAHVIAVPHAVELRIGDTTIDALVNPEGSIDKDTLARFDDIAMRINAELDMTGRMSLYRAAQITHEFAKRQRQLDLERAAHWLRGQFVAEARKHEPAPDDYRETADREAWEAMAFAVLREGFATPASFAIPFPWKSRRASAKTTASRNTSRNS